MSPKLSLPRKLTTYNAGLLFSFFRHTSILLRIEIWYPRLCSTSFLGTCLGIKISLFIIVSYFIFYHVLGNPKLLIDIATKLNRRVPRVILRRMDNQIDNVHGEHFFSYRKLIRGYGWTRQCAKKTEREGYGRLWEGYVHRGERRDGSTGGEKAGRGRRETEVARREGGGGNRCVHRFVNNYY